MPWQIGIDEAGYGPNLGPFVMTLVAAACARSRRRPVGFAQTLRAPLRRRRGRAAHRRRLQASVFAGERLERSEKSVLAGMCESLTRFQSLLEHVSAVDLPALRKEVWFIGDTALPTSVEIDCLADLGSAWQAACESATVAWGFRQCVVVPAPRFNDLIDKWDSKGAVLGVALTQLIEMHAHAPRGTAAFHHRQTRRPQLYSASATRLRRRLRDRRGGRPLAKMSIAWTDSTGHPHHLHAKGGRDLVPRRAGIDDKQIRARTPDREFNRYWLTHVPGLAPTAGYPGDALRYFDAIRPVLTKLGIAERAVWRMR